MRIRRHLWKNQPQTPLDEQLHLPCAVPKYVDHRCRWRCGCRCTAGGGWYQWRAKHTCRIASRSSGTSPPIMAQSASPRATASHARLDWSTCRVTVTCAPAPHTLTMLHSLDSMTLAWCTAACSFQHLACVRMLSAQRQSCN